MVLQTGRDRKGEEKAKEKGRVGRGCKREGMSVREGKGWGQGNFNNYFHN